MRRLVSRVRAHKELGVAVVKTRLRGPNREARLIDGRCFLRGHVDHAERVDMCHRHGRRAGRELRLREGVNLRAVEAVGCPRIRVCGDVKAVPVRADVRVVAQARARIDAAGVCAVIRDIHAIDVP